MKKLLSLVFMLTAVCSFTTTAFSQETIISKEITIREFDKMIKSNPGQIIDIRTKGEVAKGVVPGSVNIDFFDDNFAEKIDKLDKDKPVYVYCASGGRSGESIAIFKEKGFKEIYDVAEGYSGYKKVHKD